MSNAEIIELIEAIAWPAVVAGGLWYFRDAIVAVLPRVTRVGPVTLDSVPPTQNVPAISDAASSEALKRVEAILPPELLSEGRKLIEASVPRNEQSEKISEVQYLTTLAAVLTLVALFEKTYGTIWGSQLELLQLSNSHPQSGETAKAIYDKAAAENPTIYEHYEFTQWLAFLADATLLRRDPDGHLAITLRGRAFLRFIIESGYSFTRQF